MSGPHPQQQHNSHFAAKRKSQQMALHTFRRPLEFARDATAKSRQCRRISHINTFCWRIESAARARHKTHSLKLFSQACRAINFHCSPLSSRSPFPAARKKALREFCVRQFWKSAFKRTCAPRVVGFCFIPFAYYARMEAIVIGALLCLCLGLPAVGVHTPV